MTASRARAGEARWLEADEMAAWLALLRVVVTLPQGLDRQLRREAGITHISYSILAVLSTSHDRCQTMRALAEATGTSLSRLSHAVDALAERGLVARRPSRDRRRQLAELTDAGAALLTEIAPGHVAEVRRLVFDHLERHEVAMLGAALRRIGEATSAALR
ncbi:MAG: MarR family winged helix-turn-helix transcriptional regulator [Actinomycetota bacterium]|nr:MarR family winged helix-turn-helix transcriptional regulator [Actinomycetota bacterium]